MEDSENKELVATVSDGHNWKGIIISLLVIAGIIGLIAVAVIMVTPPLPGPRVTGSRFSVEHIISGQFDPPTFRGKWISSTEVAFRDDQGGVSLLHTPNRTVTQLISNITARVLNVDEFDVSPDKKYILLRHNDAKESPLNELHPVAKYSVLEVNISNSQHVEAVTPFPDKPGHPQLIYAAWVPGTSQKIIMIHDNDIYVQESPASPVVQRVTDSGTLGLIYNGVTDLLYKDYIFKSTSAFWLSSDGAWLCFASFNDSAVRKSIIPLYTQEQDYLQTIRYPMVDSPNPNITLQLVDLTQSSANSRIIKPPFAFKNQDHYITSVRWVTTESFVIVWRNRAQNISVSMLCQVVDGHCQEIYIEESSSNEWLVNAEAPLVGHNDSSYVVMAPLVDADIGTFMHLHQGSAESRHHRPLTYGPYTVFELHSWDTENHYVYYTANLETDTSSRHLWRVRSLQSTDALEQECLTCAINDTLTDCKHFTTFMGINIFDEVVLHCEGPSVPYTFVYSIPDNEIVLYLHKNEALQELSNTMAWPITETFRVPLDQTATAKVRLSIPPDYDPASEMSFPVVLSPAGTPGEQTVNYKWRTNWNTYLATNRSWVVVEVDGRTSGGRDLRELFLTAGSLGKVQAEDHIIVMKYLLSTLKFLDGSRVSAWGWGHAGYNAAAILPVDNNHIFSCVATVGAPMDWQHYVSFYSEGFMGISQVVPGGNYRGYEETSLLKQAKYIRNGSLMIIHATADHNVFYTHSLNMARQLTKNNIIFRMLSYPDESHSLHGVQRHLYYSMEIFIQECFPPYTQDEIDLANGV